MKKLRIKLRSGMNIILPEPKEIILIDKKTTVKSPIDEEFTNGLKFMSKIRAQKLKKIEIGR